MGKAVVWINLERHRRQQSVGCDWLLEFSQELPLRGLDFTEVLHMGGKMHMKLRSGRKILERASVVEFGGGGAVGVLQVCRSVRRSWAAPAGSLQGIRQQEKSCQGGGQSVLGLLIIIFKFLVRKCSICAVGRELYTVKVNSTVCTSFSMSLFSSFVLQLGA